MLNHRRFTTLSAVLVAALLSAATASAALEAYVKIKGSKQGQFKGETDKTKADAVRILGYKVVDATGAGVGKRRHAPIVITKEVDAASPQLLQALAANEALTQLSIISVNPDKKGGPDDVTIDALNARVTKIDHVSADPQHPALAKGKAYEEISFAYQKLTWTWVQGGKTAEDDWETPN